MTLSKTALTLSMTALLTTAAFAQPAPTSPAAAPVTVPTAAVPTAAAPAAVATPTSPTATAPAAPAVTSPATPAAAAPAAVATPASPEGAATPMHAEKKTVLSRYTYINNDSEYTVDLPEAPVATTIWGDQKAPIPYLENPPRFGPIGETATYRRVNETTGEYIETSVTFLKADRDFLLTRTPESMQEALDNEVKNIRLEDKKFKFAPGQGTVKRMVLTGFSVDKNNNALYNALYYLTGNESLMVIKVQYNIENKDFNAQYQQMAASIKFIGK